MTFTRLNGRLVSEGHDENNRTRMYRGLQAVSYELKEVAMVPVALCAMAAASAVKAVGLSYLYLSGGLKRDLVELTSQIDPSDNFNTPKTRFNLFNKTP